MDTTKLAQENFNRHIGQNKYPGRGIVVGKSSSSDSWNIIYWIMGRSDSSRNRRFVVEGSTLRTEPVNPSLVIDPSLIIYEAMLELPGIYLVSNGAQTQIIHQALSRGATFESALDTCQHEPDAPHFTPRISTMLNIKNGSPSLTFSILKANIADSQLTDRFIFRYPTVATGLGLGITTYRGDDNPIPSFIGEPLILPCEGSADDLLDTYWNALNSENRVAIALKQIDINQGPSKIFVRNRF